MAKEEKSIIQIIKIPKIYDDAFLCFAQTPDQVPFNIQRVYYIFGAEPNLARGKHAHKTNRQILFCIQGKIRMLLDNGKKKEEIVLSNPEDGILLDKMVWHEMLDMDEKTILLVLASEKFDSKDYIREYGEFIKIYRSKKI